MKCMPKCTMYEKSDPPINSMHILRGPGSSESSTHIAVIKGGVVTVRNGRNGTWRTVDPFIGIVTVDPSVM